MVLNTIPLVTNQSLFDKLPWDPVRGGGPALFDTLSGQGSRVPRC